MNAKRNTKKCLLKEIQCFTMIKLSLHMLTVTVVVALKIADRITAVCWMVGIYTAQNRVSKCGKEN
jgi:hypothetical protein